MTKRQTVRAAGFITIIAAALWLANDRITQAQDRGKQLSPQEMQKAMEQWIASMQPGEHHARLEPLAGKWKTTSRIWMAGPDAPPIENTGSTEARWVLGKRYLHQEHEGEMTMPDATGQMKKSKFNGIGMMGYDNVRGMYVGTWADDMSTAILTFKGTLDPDGKTFRMYGEMDEPMLGMYGRHVKYVTRIKSNDEHVFEMYDLAAGDNHKVMEITYQRVK